MRQPYFINVWAFFDSMPRSVVSMFDYSAAFDFIKDPESFGAEKRNYYMGSLCGPKP